MATLFHNWFIDFLLLLLLPPLFVAFCAIMIFCFPEYVRNTCLPNGPEDAKKFFITQGLVLLAFNLWIVFWGYYVRFGEPGEACSGDFYTKNDEPESYLWSSGRVIGRIVTVYMYLLGAIAALLVLAAWIYINEKTRVRIF